MFNLFEFDFPVSVSYLKYTSGKMVTSVSLELVKGIFKKSKVKIDEINISQNKVGKE
jgi:hypothetical protein